RRRAARPHPFAHTATIDAARACHCCRREAGRRHPGFLLANLFPQTQRIAQAALAASRSIPRANMSGGRSPKRKGGRVERELVRLLLEHGLVCARVPLSGGLGGVWSGDIHLELLGRTYRVEVKSRARLATLHRWLSAADLLLLKANRLQPIAVLPLT